MAHITPNPIKHLALSILVVPVLLIGVTLGSSAGASSKPVTISITKTSAHGSVLSDGHTLYVLAPSKVLCGASCEMFWPLVTLAKGQTKALAGPGVMASRLGKIKLPDGLYQVTYNGKGLHKFSEDTSATSVNGDLSDTWGKWSAVVVAKAKGTTSTTQGPGGGGY
jgi:predicted lipoprotein with Yx(FWY)xxD motif